MPGKQIEPVYKQYFDGAQTVARIKRLEEIIKGLTRVVESGNLKPPSNDDEIDDKLSIAYMEKFIALGNRITEVEVALGNLESATNDVTCTMDIHSIPNETISRIVDQASSVHSP
jgi:hypothetical protein